MANICNSPIIGENSQRKPTNFSQDNYTVVDMDLDKPYDLNYDKEFNQILDEVNNVPVSNGEIVELIKDSAIEIDQNHKLSVFENSEEESEESDDDEEPPEKYKIQVITF